jgi:hypothetical protein
MRSSIIFLFLLLTLTAFSNPQPRGFAYLSVNASFRDCFEGYQSGPNVLRTATDTAGNIYVSSNALNEFPELFDTMGGYQIVWLPSEAFRVDSVDTQ